MSMSDDELLMFDSLMIRLLPPAPHTETGKTRVIVALREMFTEMKPRLNLKVRDLLKQNNKTTWQSLVKDAAIGVIEETRLFEEYMCSICIGKLSHNGDNTPDLVSMACCKHVYHRSCFKEWIASGGEICPMCSTPVTDEKLVELGLARPVREPTGEAPTSPEFRALYRQLQADEQARIRQRTEAAVARILAGNDTTPNPNPARLAVITFCVIVAIVFANST